MTQILKQCIPSVLQVLVPAAGIRGFLDASEYGTWLKHFQSISQGDEESKQNVKHFLLAGQVSWSEIWYENI